MTRLLIECTNVFLSPHVNTGIQRVVRNIVAHLDDVAPQEAVECIPVALGKGRLCRVLRLIPRDGDRPWPARLYERCERAGHGLWSLNGRFEGLWPMRDSAGARAALGFLLRLASLPLFTCMRLLRLLGYDPLQLRAEPFEHRAGDRLVLLDSSWHASRFPTLERLKRDGVVIVAVIHDLIPLARPEFSEARLRSIFMAWFDWVSLQAEGFVGVSRTVREHVRAEISCRFGKQQAEARWYGYFHHGCELDLVQTDAAPPEEMLAAFASGSVYLSVGTIEPRKNHEYLLDAFEQAWAAGSNARLCLIGRIGWKREALIGRIHSHEELGRRLFMFNDVSDSGLQYAYRNARALVFSSHDEGFGLPLVEAMQRGLPVMASDIPVFREIGGGYVAFFDLREPRRLAELVIESETSGVFPAPLSLEGWHWNDWRSACRQLVTTVLQRGGEETAVVADGVDARSS